jgi:hypothetical protein
MAHETPVLAPDKRTDLNTKAKKKDVPEWYVPIRVGTYGMVCHMPAGSDVWDRELREIKIDREELVKNADRYRMGSVRLALGRVCTREQFESEKRRILQKPMP